MSKSKLDAFDTRYSYKDKRAKTPTEADSLDEIRRRPQQYDSGKDQEYSPQDGQYQSFSSDLHRRLSMLEDKCSVIDLLQKQNNLLDRKFEDLAMQFDKLMSSNRPKPNSSGSGNLDMDRIKQCEERCDMMNNKLDKGLLIIQRDLQDFERTNQTKIREIIENIVAPSLQDLADTVKGQSIDIEDLRIQTQEFIKQTQGDLMAKLQELRDSSSKPLSEYQTPERRSPFINKKHTSNEKNGQQQQLRTSDFRQEKPNNNKQDHPYERKDLKIADNNFTQERPHLDLQSRTNNDRNYDRLTQDRVAQERNYDRGNERPQQDRIQERIQERSFNNNYDRSYDRQPDPKERTNTKPNEYDRYDRSAPKYTDEKKEKDSFSYLKMEDKRYTRSSRADDQDQEYERQPIDKDKSYQGYAQTAPSRKITEEKSMALNDVRNKNISFAAEDGEFRQRNDTFQHNDYDETRKKIDDEINRRLMEENEKRRVLLQKENEKGDKQFKHTPMSTEKSRSKEIQNRLNLERKTKQEKINQLNEYSQYKRK